MASSSPSDSSAFLPRDGLAALLDVLRKRGFEIIAPALRDGVIVLAPLAPADELPREISDEQSPGRYRTIPGSTGLTFEHVVGPDSAKRHLFPPAQRLVEFRLRADGFEVVGGPPPVPRLAFVGLRPCDVAAIKIQDQVFGTDDPTTMRCEAEPWYTAVRAKSLVIAVNCTRPGGNCFCASMGTGPAATAGYDLALTEMQGGFVITAGSDRGRELLAEVPVRPPSQAELELAELKITRAREHMGRRMDTADIKPLLDRTVEHPLWEEIASRCLSCGNCTMVCPTCFCSTVCDSTNLAGDRFTRNRHWESCFTHQFSHTTPGPVRNTVRGRYRHWLRHKLCTWWEQFGCSGCVGCGRCITWCPVGIDLTREIDRLRKAATTPAAAETAKREVAS